MSSGSRLATLYLGRFLLVGTFGSTTAQTARSEAQQAFGTPDVYAEKFIEHPRHIEYQVLGDQHGQIIHLGERECSIQRRHQKLVEESPSPAIDAKQRKELGAEWSRRWTRSGTPTRGRWNS